MSEEMLEFVEAVTDWHNKKTANLRHVQDSVKKGTLLKVGSDDQEGSEMSSRDAAFFKAGMEAVLMELGTLPFTVIRNTDEDENRDGLKHEEL